MKNQISIIFIGILIAASILALIFIISSSSIVRQTFSQMTQKSFYYYEIASLLFSPSCLSGYAGNPMYYVDEKILENFSKNYNNTLPPCGKFPYAFRLYIDNYSIGINNVKISCSNHSFFISLSGKFDRAFLEICENYYSYFYTFLYNFCLDSNVNESSSIDVIFTYETYVYNNTICSRGICNKIPCEFLYEGNLNGSKRVYAKKVENNKILLIY